MTELIPVGIFFGAFLLFMGGVAAAMVALVRWRAKEKEAFSRAAEATGFERVAQLHPGLASRLAVLAQDDPTFSRAVVPWARREAGYTILLHGFEGGEDGPPETWQLKPAVHAPGLAIPRLTLLPRSEVGDRVAGWIGRVVAWRSRGVLRTVSFAGDPRFEPLYEVLGADEEAVRAFLDERRRAALAAKAGCFVVAEGDLFTFDRLDRSRGPRGEKARLAWYVADGYDLLAVLWG